VTGRRYPTAHAERSGAALAGAFFGAVTAALIIGFPFALLNAWILMLTVGGLHAEFGWPDRTFSFWLCAGVNVFLLMALRPWRPVEGSA
jgi:hypothetical protein